MLTFRNQRVLFTADDHFFHDDIIIKCARPYQNVDDMNADLRQRWNAVAGPDDYVIHLGDVAMGLPALWPSLLAGLNGHKFLVRGNHDRSGKWYHGAFTLLDRNTVVSIDGVLFWLNHYPSAPPGARGKHRRPPAPGRYDVALCGHIHDKWLVRDGVINVGVDVWDFTPVCPAQLLAVDR